MSQPVQQGQPGLGQPNAAQMAARQAQMYKPEQMRQIQFLSDDEKAKYETGLRQLWNLYEKSAEGSLDKEAAKKKIQDFTPVLMKKLRERRMAAQAAQGGQGGLGGQGGPQQPNVATGPQSANAHGGAAGATPAVGKPTTGPGHGETPVPIPIPPGARITAPGPQQTGPQQKALPEAIQKHLAQMTFHPPPQIGKEGPEAVAKWQEEAKKKYSTSLIQMESYRMQMAKIDSGIKARADAGSPLSAEEQRQIEEKKKQFKAVVEEAQKFVGSFRKQQELINQARAKATAASAAGSQGPGQAMRPQPNPQQPNQANTQPSNASLQNSQANINGAIEAAKKEQAAAAGRIPGVTGMAPTVPPSQPGQITSSQPSGAQSHTAAAQIKIEAGVQPQPHPHPANINTNLQNVKPGISTPTPTSARIQTPQTANPISGAPRALSHQKALEEANRQRANSTTGVTLTQPATGTPASGIGVIGAAANQGHPHAHPTQNQQQQSLPSKMPIAKNLPEKATLPPQPVSIGGGINPGRPTYTGGSGIGGGVMGQPAVNKVPAIQMDSEGERVLNKKKLDELVRQVCGGTAEGQEGNMLLPEVEESVLNLADSFVDSVLHSACRNSKERGSKVLEIRDIQLVLERAYNIRIPGYSSDELRTVRKVQPSPAWISKMSAVQAAKVMPGKDGL